MEFAQVSFYHEGTISHLVSHKEYKLIGYVFKIL